LLTAQFHPTSFVITPDFGFLFPHARVVMGQGNQLIVLNCLRQGRI